LFIRYLENFDTVPCNRIKIVIIYKNFSATMIFAIKSILNRKEPEP
jgi:hypothetical protein